MTKPKSVMFFKQCSPFMRLSSLFCLMKATLYLSYRVVALIVLLHFLNILSCWNQKCLTFAASIEPDQLLVGQLQVLNIISLKIILDSTINGNWVIPL